MTEESAMTAMIYRTGRSSRTAELLLALLRDAPTTGAIMAEEDSGWI